MYHPFEFTETYTLNSLENDLIYIQRHNIRTCTLSELAAEQRFDLNRTRINKEHNLLTNWFPSLKRWSYTYNPWYIYFLWVLNLLLYWLPICIAIVMGNKKRGWFVIGEILLGVMVALIALLHIAPLKLWLVNIFVCMFLSLLSRRIKT